MKTNGFLNPVEIRELINANTDENAPHFVFMTVHGTVFGHDRNNDINAVRKFGAFTGTTWLRHAKAVAETGAASTEPDFGLNGKTLEVVITKDGKGLHHMVVQVDDMVSAICYVKEKTLLAAQMEKEQFVDENDEVSAMIQDLDLADRNDTSVTNDMATNKVATTAKSEDNGKETGNVVNSDGNESATTDQGEDSVSDDAASSSSPQQTRLSKLRILKIRAEAMAEAFREDICGPAFKMPPEFR